MKLNEVKTALEGLEVVRFQLPNGEIIPKHFHITEVGQVEKNFIDCGGTVRSEKKINFQLWTSIDFDHRLAPQKMKSILDLSEETLGLGDDEIEVEYQGETIGKFGLNFDGQLFKLEPTQTDCLAKDNCGIPKPVVKLAELGSDCCGPGSTCC